MADGWACEVCGSYHLDCHIVSKITVSIEPRDFEAAVTVCSLACFDEMRTRFDDLEAVASEQRGDVKRIMTVHEEWIY